MRKKTLFEATEEYQGELQSLGGMQRHQRDAGRLVVTVGVADQGCMVEEFFDRLTPIFRVEGGVDEFAEVLDARQRLRRVFILKQLDVAGAVDEEFQELAGISFAAGDAEGRGMIVRSVARHACFDRSAGVPPA